MPTPTLPFHFSGGRFACMPRWMLLTACAAILGVCVGAASTSTGEPPSGSSITFVAKNLFSTANGIFHEWRVVASEVPAADFAAGHVEVEVDLASVDTGIERRDEHLLTADFFDVEKYPVAKIRVHSVAAQGVDADGRETYSARFDVDLHGAQKTLDGAFAVVSRSPLRVEGELVMNRLDFGIGEPASRWNPMSIGEEIPVSFEATLP